MNLWNLFAAAVVCALLALSHGAHAERPDAATIVQPQEAAAALPEQAREPAALTVAQVQQLKKRILTDPPPPRGPGSFKATPGGEQAFEACCESCPAGGCTGCNSYPNTPHLSCGSGLIKANCQVVDDTVTCVKDDG